MLILNWNLIISNAITAAISGMDYSGTYGGLMKEKGIKSRLLHGQVGFRFTIELASSRTVYVTTDPDYAHGCLEAIKIFYTLLGDKQLINISGREFRINW
jgi:hypothetical protein